MLTIIQTPTSSNISRFGWAPDTLYIEFKSTSQVYAYPGVTKALYEEMCTAPSVGSFFHASIRKAFEAVKLTEPDARWLGFETVTNEVT